MHFIPTPAQGRIVAISMFEYPLHEFSKRKVHMNRISKSNLRIIAMLSTVLGVGAVVLSACGTVEGAGRDVEYVGEQMSGASRDVQN